jgi:Zn-finger domain-containing protein
MAEEYNENTILGKYAKTCELIGEPLSDLQLKNLEKIISTSFVINISKNPDDLRAIGEIDKDLIRKIAEKGYGKITATRLLNIIEESKKIVSEKELLSIYYNAKGYAEVSYRTPEGMGRKSFDLLKDYLVARGIVPIE